MHPTTLRVSSTALLSLSCALLASCSTLHSDDVSAKELESAREVVKTNANGIDPRLLKGISTVSVAIDRTSDFEKVKITDNELLNPLTLKLRRAGLKVVTMKEALRNSGEELPLLQQSIRTFQSESGDTIFSVETKLFDYAILTRDMKQREFVPIWENLTPELDGVRKSQSHNAIVKACDKQADEFLSDYLKHKGL